MRLVCPALVVFLLLVVFNLARNRIPRDKTSTWIGATMTHGCFAEEKSVEGQGGS